MYIQRIILNALRQIWQVYQKFISRNRPNYNGIGAKMYTVTIKRIVSLILFLPCTSNAIILMLKLNSTIMVTVMFQFDCLAMYVYSFKT